MDKLVIKDKEYEVPRVFTIGQFQRIMQLQDDSQIISAAFGVPMNEVALLPAETKKLATLIVRAILSQPAQNELTPIKFNELKIGELVDIEIWINRGIVPNYVKLADQLIEGEITEDTYYNDVAPIIEKFYKYRISLYKQYPSLFGGGGDNNEEVEDKQFKTPITQVWYNIIMLLAEGKFINIHQVIERPAIEAFNWLTWKKNEQMKEIQQMKKIELQRKSMRR